MTIHFELVSPEDKIFSEPVYMAVMPGEEGEFGVGQNHASLVASLNPGVVQLIKDQGTKPRRVFITGGFADVTGTQCTLLAEEAILVEDLDEKLLRSNIANLEKDIGTAREELDKNRFRDKLVIEQAKLTALTGEIPSAA